MFKAYEVLFFFKSIFILLGCKSMLQFVITHGYQWVAVSISLPNSCSHQWVVSCWGRHLSRVRLGGFNVLQWWQWVGLLHRQQGSCICLLLWLFHSCSPAEAGYWVGGLTCHCHRGGPPHTSCLTVTSMPLFVSILLLECPSLNMGSRLGRLSWGCTQMWLGLSGPPYEVLISIYTWINFELQQVWFYLVPASAWVSDTVPVQSQVEGDEEISVSRVEAILQAMYLLLKWATKSTLMMRRLKRSKEVRKGTGYLVDPQTRELGHQYMGLYKKRNMKHVCQKWWNV